MKHGDQRLSTQGWHHHGEQRQKVGSGAAKTELRKNSVVYTRMGYEMALASVVGRRKVPMG